MGENQGGRCVWRRSQGQFFSAPEAPPPRAMSSVMRRQCPICIVFVPGRRLAAGAGSVGAGAGGAKRKKKYRLHFLGVSQVSSPPRVAQCWFPPVSGTESQRNFSSLRRGRALLSAESCGDAARGRNAGTGFSAGFSVGGFLSGAPAPSPQSFPHGLSFLCGQVWWSWAVFCAGVGGARFIGATPAAKNCSVRHRKSP